MRLKGHSRYQRYFLGDEAGAATRRAPLVETLYISSVTIAELLFGIGALPDGRRKQKLAETLDGILPLFGGRILAFDTGALALLRILGTPASAAYVEDSYCLAQKGRAGLAIGIGVIGSVLGGLFGFLLLFTALMLPKAVLGFSSFEYFWLAVLGLSYAALISSGGLVKGALALLLGLFIAQVGMDPLTAKPRFTFGNLELMGGISFIPVMIGMFAVSEVMRYGRRAADGAQEPFRRCIGHDLEISQEPGLRFDHRLASGRPARHRRRLGRLDYHSAADVPGMLYRTVTLRPSEHFEKNHRSPLEPASSGSCVRQQC